MTDPYKVLGINYGADEHELREAYKRCAAMYSDNPYKMAQIDSAYDEILSQTRYGYSSYARNENEIRDFINNDNLYEAQRLLDETPADERKGEWYFLQGLIHQKKGRLNKAFDSYETALNFDPGNTEYQNAYEAMNQSRNGGYRRTKAGNDKDGCCNICSGLLCADCCCECMGGDLIPCC